jgi:hypothetical protein
MVGSLLRFVGGVLVFVVVGHEGRFVGHERRCAEHERRFVGGVLEVC